MIKSQFNRYVRAALAKRQRKSNIDEANAVIDVFVEAIKEALSENEEILLVGFGRFIKSKVEARNGINPKTGQPIKIAATYLLKIFNQNLIIFQQDLIHHIFGYQYPQDGY
ncbi:MAG: hypothetical protein EBT99_15460 [Betaproteobacteria bacterium]|nr:hypothetical protein [Betaproteobacteria bacterium]